MMTKYKVWDREGKTLEDVGAIDWADGKPITVNTRTKKLYQMYPEDPEYGFDLMQYTGFEDGEGADIYHGFILDVTGEMDDNEVTAEVIWDEDEGCWGYIRDDGDETEQGPLRDIIDARTRVIGHVHE